MSYLLWVIVGVSIGVGIPASIEYINKVIDKRKE
jgi:hypothetical protein